MTEWKTYKLGDITIMRNGKKRPNTQGTYPVYGGNGIMDYTDCYNAENTIIVGRVGAYCGNVYQCKNKCWVSDNAISVSANELVDDNYLYYLMSSLDFHHHHIGGAQPLITQDIIGGFEIFLPPLEEQRRIAGILGAIDDKIENNRRINDNLEQQAQALYKQWFVDFEFPNEEGKPYKSSGGKMVDSELGLIPEGWSVGALSDLADITMGQSPNGKSFNENGEGIVFYQGRTEFGIRYPSIRLYTTEPTRYAEPMSVLLSVRAPVGDINIATQKCCIGRGVASIKSKTDDNAYMYCCLKELRPQLDQYNGEGTVFGSINRKELEGLALCIPKNEVISQFNNLVLGMDRQMLNLFQQTQNLATLRDTLLPKLMNGEIKV
jgi:type I restriction enzyme S subunit